MAGESYCRPCKFFTDVVNKLNDWAHYVAGVGCERTAGHLVGFQRTLKNAASKQLRIARANILTTVIVVTDNEHLLKRTRHTCTAWCFAAAPHLKVAEFNQMFALS